MKKGLDLGTLMSTLKFRHENRRDFISNTLSLRLVWDNDDNQINAIIGATTRVIADLTPYALHQICTHCGIHISLVKDILKDGTVLEKEALVHLINTRLHAAPTQRLIRTIRDFLEPERIIAFLSDRYLRIDNWPLLNSIMPVLKSNTDYRIVSTHVDDTHMHIKVVNIKSTAQIGSTKVEDTKGNKVGDIIQSGVLISNSEVGIGSVQLRPFVVRLVCSNGMVATTEYGNIRKMHVGPVITDSDKQIKNEVFLQNIAERLGELLADTSVIKKLAGLFEAAKSFKITGDIGLMWLSLKDYGLYPTEINALKEVEVANKFDVVNAITHFAGTSRKVELGRSTELEIIAGRILGMTKPQWAKISNQKLII